jgi:hypothetical protein
MPTTTKSKIEKPSTESKRPVESENLQEIFADGVTSFLLGPLVSKITLYSDIGKTKKSVVRITMPTGTMIRLCKQVLSSAKNGEENIIEKSSEIGNRIVLMLSDVNFATSNNIEVKES